MDKVNRMNNKQIIGIIVLIFVLLVGYKIISSNIQESKEKAVQQDKYQLDQLQRSQDAMNQQKIVDQLNSCLATTQNEAAFSATKLKNSSKCDTYTNPNLEAQCLQGEINIQNQIIARLNQEKNDCYKRYK